VFGIFSRTTRIGDNKGFIIIIPLPIHGHIIRFLIEALNNSIVKPMAIYVSPRWG